MDYHGYMSYPPQTSNKRRHSAHAASTAKQHAVVTEWEDLSEIDFIEDLGVFDCLIKAFDYHHPDQLAMCVPLLL